MKTPILHVRTVRGMGRGVFAGQRIRKGAIIETCPLLVFRREEFDPLGYPPGSAFRGSTLEQYVFGFGDSVAIALGYGSLYNHSRSPNAFHTKHMGRQILRLFAARQIEKGEQIFIDYGWETLPFIDAA